MNRILFIVLLCIVSMGVRAQKNNIKEKEVVKFEVAMDGHCCIDEINEGFAYEKGVKSVKCDFDSKTVTITYRKDKTDVETLINAFTKIGKNATVIKEETKLEGTSHVGCSWHLHI